MEQQPAELSFEFDLRLEELHPEALRRGDEARLVAGSTSWASSTTRYASRARSAMARTVRSRISRS
jgi:hypothetical protein